ncbi:hypothetical protein Acr_22g0007890 [Actinidia rufa]|uniref:Uncharacterized protein n=1 Tax=Actinidia rufa TaxID=165716 RepID=A0A7J0GKX2_9ERIC|nr:hypothetical protein Acr_22g0007890 [Actinidia rufa]
MDDRGYGADLGWFRGLTRDFTDLVFEFEDATVFGRSGDALLRRTSDLELGAVSMVLLAVLNASAARRLAVVPMTALVLGNLVGEQAGVTHFLWVGPVACGLQQRLGQVFGLMVNAVTGCLPSGVSPGFGINLISSPSSLLLSWVWRVLFFPDFFSDRLPNPPTAGYGSDRGFPRAWRLRLVGNSTRFGMVTPNGTNIGVYRFDGGRKTTRRGGEGAKLLVYDSHVPPILSHCLLELFIIHVCGYAAKISPVCSEMWCCCFARWCCWAPNGLVFSQALLQMKWVQSLLGGFLCSQPCLGLSVSSFVDG